jgi:hypothetical protein
MKIFATKNTDVVRYSDAWFIRQIINGKSRSCASKNQKK